MKFIKFSKIRLDYYYMKSGKNFAKLRKNKLDFVNFKNLGLKIAKLSKIKLAIKCQIGKITLNWSPFHYIIQNNEFSK